MNSRSFYMPDGFYYDGCVRHAESAACIIPHPARILNVAGCIRPINGYPYFDLLVHHRRADGPSDIVGTPGSHLINPRFWKVIHDMFPELVSKRSDLVAKYWHDLIEEFLAREEGVK